ncbi:preprotein translocase subunit YajC [Pasteurella multocida subsp. multocida str. Anand1_buffalo]|nr:preprotein translocase subunit YajC [Pasteurella multocida subsp. multocida str. Anand1_buffalo]
MSELAKGTEVLIAGGLIGRITKVSPDSDSIIIALNETTEVTINRNYVVAVLPKGSLKS